MEYLVCYGEQNKGTLFFFLLRRAEYTRGAKGHHHHRTREEKPPLLLVSLPAGKQLCATTHRDGLKPHNAVTSGGIYPAQNASLVRVSAAIAELFLLFRTSENKKAQRVST